MNVTADVLHALRRDLYPADRCIWATEVTVPESDPVRRMDACIIDTRLGYVEGFEVKVSRGDWLNDKGGEKSAPARSCVDRFWFVFGSDAIAGVEEVPSGCGVITIKDGHAQIVKAAAYPDKDSLGTIRRDIIRAVLARSLNMDRQEHTTRLQAEAEAKGYQKGLNAAKRRSPLTRDGRIKHSARVRGEIPEPIEDEDGLFCP